MAAKSITFRTMLKHRQKLDVKLESFNPATKAKIAEYPALSDKELEKKVQHSESVWRKWRLVPFSKREDLLERLSSCLLSKKESLAEIITQEMGKPLNQSVQEIEKCALLCQYYRDQGQKFLSRREESLHYKKSYVHYAPLGGTLGIMPWNYPFWQVFRFAIPSLFAGNAVFLKPSENVMGCALAIEKLFIESACPQGLFSTLPIYRSQLESLIAHPFIKTVSFTGSVSTGRHISTLCGRHLKKSVLELGGSDPHIVLKDADLDKAARQIALSRLNNSGQSCIAAKRLIVEHSITEDLMQNMIQQFKQKTISHPLYNPDVGPLAKKEFVEELEGIRDRDRALGAQILFEKSPKAEDMEQGWYFPITLMAACSAQMDCARKETFGPLLPVFSVKHKAQALDLALDSPFGLGAVVWTRDEVLGESWARDLLPAGSCFVNGQLRSNPSLPFGGVGNSGYGRELSSEGLRELVNIKTVVVC